MKEIKEAARGITVQALIDGLAFFAVMAVETVVALLILG